MKDNNEASVLTILPLIFYIRGKCNVVLDVYYTQSKAIKTYILEYKDKVEEAQLVMIRNGVQYRLTPSGSVRDYIKH